MLPYPTQSHDINLDPSPVTRILLGKEVYITASILEHPRKQFGLAAIEK
jgi:hypothetical protein